MAKKEKYDENGLPRLSKEEIEQFESENDSGHYESQLKFIKRYGWLILLVIYLVVKGFLIYQSKKNSEELEKVIEKHSKSFPDVKRPQP